MARGGPSSKKGKRKNPRGTKKGDKIHGIRKGTKGEAAAYLTRAQALAKLSLPLADFRKLCILKGIYPRDPKKKAAGMDKTYYHHKDIAFLAHEPLLSKFFELKTFMKKFKRLMGRKERDLAHAFETRKPEYTLHHLVRERYPSFEDSLRDMDDAISMLALFQSLSADQKRDIPIEAINDATRLYQEFQLYVIRAQCLKKCFASIKGYYFQAEICGQMVTWLSPHQFAQDLPPEVDFRVMLTFLEFYRAVTKFVNFKLYADLGLAYPPTREERRHSASAEVAALEAEMREAGKACEAQTTRGLQDDAQLAIEVAKDFGEQSEEALAMQKQIVTSNRLKTTFRGLRVFVSREVPLRPVYFVLLCGGATAVGWERGECGKDKAPGSAFHVTNKTITHQIVDRPSDKLEERREGREYVQPQWVFDSFNTGCLLPIAPYAPGRAPPPHLSPFADDKAEGYVPRQREILDKFAAEASGTLGEGASSGNADSATACDAAKTVDVDASFESFNAELRAEANGLWHSDFCEGKKERKTQQVAVAVQECAEGDREKDEEHAKPTEEEEEHLRRKALMPKKHKRLLQRIEKSAKEKADATLNLQLKRRRAEEVRDGL